MLDRRAAVLFHLLLIGFELVAIRSGARMRRAFTPPAEPSAEWSGPRKQKVGPPPYRFQHIPLLDQAPPEVPPFDFRRQRERNLRPAVPSSWIC